MNQDTPQIQTSQPAKLQASVDYLPGITIAGARNALLEWSADDHIKFFIMDDASEKAEELLFDVPVSQIERVGGGANMITLYVAGKAYNAQFSRTAALKLGIGGGIGMAAAYRDIKATGVMLWIEKFRENNVKLEGFRDVNWVVKASLVGAMVCIGGALLITAIIVFAAVL